MEYLQLPLFQESKLRRTIMVKFILKEADENSPIYKTGFIISPLKLNKSIKIRHKGGAK